MKYPSSTSKIWSLCNCGSKMLGESLVYNKTNDNEMISVFIVRLFLKKKIIPHFNFMFFPNTPQYVQLLICDWLLETRTSCWEINQNCKLSSESDDESYCNPLPSRELEQFQNDLNSLYCIIDQVPVSIKRIHMDRIANSLFIFMVFDLFDSQMAKSRIYLYEAVSRLMAGAAPGYTQELLDRSFHEQYRRNARTTFHCGGTNNNINNNSNNTNTNNNNIELNHNNSSSNRRRCGQSSNVSMDGERERAAAMYVACKYLPNPLLCPGERSGLLVEAAKTLKKIGNRKKLNDCYQLMKSFGTTSVSTTTNCN